MEIKLPSLGEGIESGDVLEILVNVGDVVKKEQSLIEMETDKATVSVPSPVAGKILSITVKEGQSVPVGSVIATIEASGAAAPAPAKAPAPAAPAAAAPAAAAPAQQPAAPPAPAPVPQQAAAPVAPKAEPIRPAPVAPARPVAVPAAPVATAPVSAPAEDEGTPFADDVIPAGPAIRRLAREVGVDLASVVGTGEGGRITREDVMAVVRHASQAARTPAPAAPAPASGISESKSASKSRQPICRERLPKTIMVRSASIA